MKLLIITQKVDINDDILGFFHRWIEEFAKNVESIIVICLEEGEHNLPQNVKVLSLGKEAGVSRLKYILNFYKYIWKLRASYSYVFVHMNQIYVILGGFLWRLLGKRVALWYTHKQVSFSLRLAEKFVQQIFTASKQSFQLKSKKVNVMGHGIYLNDYSELAKERGEVINILHVGRLSKIKNILTLVEAGKILNDSWDRKFKITFVGSAVTKNDKLYIDKVNEYIKNNDLSNIFEFVGSVPNKDIKNFYAKADITVNMAPTGGLDKVVLEAIASSVIVISSNESFSEYFDGYDSILRFKLQDSEDLAEKIVSLINLENKSIIEDYLYKKVKDKSGLDTLVKRIISKIEM